VSKSTDNARNEKYEKSQMCLRIAFVLEFESASVGIFSLTFGMNITRNFTRF